MPLYEFRCDDCGVFDEWRSLAECNNPANCPSCEEPAKKVFAAPMLLSGSMRLKQENPEPKLVKRDREPETPRLRSHADGRPWMINH
jgi:putative FmdB family regulatory protein